MPTSPVIVAAFKGHADAVYAVALSPHGKTAATGSLDKSVRLWDAANGWGLRALAGPQGHTAQVYAVAFAPKGDLLASAGADAQVRLWDLAKADAPPRIIPVQVPTNAVAFDPAGTRLAAVGQDGQVRVHDVAKGALLKQFAAHVTTTPVNAAHPIYAVVWSKDGKQLVTASFDRSLRLWDAAAGTLVTEFKGVPVAVPGDKPAPPPAGFPGHRDQVFAAALSPDGKFLASGSSDRTLKLWEVATGRVVREFAAPGAKPVMAGEPAPSHPGWVHAVAFTPDGTRLVSGGPAPRNGGHLAVWSVVDGKQLAAVEGDLGPILSLAVTADGGKVLVGCGPKDRSRPDADALLLKMPGR